MRFQNSRVRTVWSAGAVLLAITLVLVVAGVTARAQQPAADPARVVAPGVAGDPANQPEVYNRLPPHKRAEVDATNALRERAAAVARGELDTGSRPAEPANPVALPDERILAGNGHIIEKGCRSLFPSSLAFPSNRWVSERSTSTKLLVCAGAAPEGQVQGGVIVTEWKGGRANAALDSNGNGPWFAAPEASSPLIIVGADGDILQVESKDGALFYFDVSALAYVSGPQASATPGLR